MQPQLKIVPRVQKRSPELPVLGRAHKLAHGFPDLGDVYDAVYEATPIPVNTQECLNAIATLQSAIESIQLQLRTPEYGGYEWSQTAKAALTFKSNQVSLLKGWLVRKDYVSHEDAIAQLQQRCDRLEAELMQQRALSERIIHQVFRLVFSKPGAVDGLAEVAEVLRSPKPLSGELARELAEYRREEARGL